MRRLQQVVLVISVAWLLFSSHRLSLVHGQDSLDRDYGDQLQRIGPREPTESFQSFEINDDLSIELMACEPLVMDPVAIAFDQWGRAFVAEMRGYSERGDQLLGRVKLLEDTNHDGRFDKSTLFADQFRWPTAIVCAFGGVLVGDAPDILFLKDTTGDGKSDVRKVLFTGLGTSNVQQLPNSLQWGIDNQIYGATGGNGGQLRRVANLDFRWLENERVPAQSPIDLKGRDFKIDPASLKLSPIAGGTQFGMTFDHWGRRLVCSNSDHCQQIILEEKYAARNQQQRIASSRVSIAEDGPAAEVFRSSAVEPWRKVRTRLRVQGLVSGPIEGGGRAAGYFTSATGITCYDGDLLPPVYSGNLFVGDVGSNLVHRKKLVGDEIQMLAVRTERQSEYLRSTDNWFRPVQLANSPDGSLIILDMYRETIEHPDSLPPIIKKHLDLNSGNQRGRIYRIVPKDKSTAQRLLPGEASPEQWVGMLAHPNGWHRRMASQVLFETFRATSEISQVAAELRRVSSRSDHPEARIRSMYLLADIDRVHERELTELLADEHPQVRIHALRLAESQLSPEIEKRILEMTTDSDIRVRFQVALTLGELQSNIRGAISDLAATDGRNRWMHSALSSSASRQRGEIMHQLVQRINTETHAVAGCGELLLTLTEQLARSATGQDVAVVGRILTSWQIQENERLFGEFVARLTRLPASKLNRLNSILESDGLSWNELVSRLLSRAMQDAVNIKLGEEQRVIAIELLRMGRPEQIAKFIPDLLDLSQPPSIKLAAIELANQVNNPEIGQSLLSHFRGLNPELRSTALQVILSRDLWTRQLLEEIESGQISVALIDAASRQRLLRHQNQSIAAAAKHVFVVGLNPDRAKLARQYLAQIDQFKGNIDRGRALFRKHCVSCHQLENQGNEIGPNLAAFANHGTAAMITNILDPNREVDPRFLSYQIQLQDGRTLLGMIDNESATTIGLRNSQGKLEIVLRNEIEVMQSTTLSLMPENLEDDLTIRDMADLVEYLISCAG